MQHFRLFYKPSGQFIEAHTDNLLYGSYTRYTHPTSNGKHFWELYYPDKNDTVNFKIVTNTDTAMCFWIELTHDYQRSRIGGTGDWFHFDKHENIMKGKYNNDESEYYMPTFDSNGNLIEDVNDSAVDSQLVMIQPFEVKMDLGRIRDNYICEYLRILKIYMGSHYTDQVSQITLRAIENAKNIKIDSSIVYDMANLDDRPNMRYE